MFSGAQLSLYPMTGDFVGVIMNALGALDPYRDRLRIESDDISTLIVGTPDVVFAAMRDLFASAASTGAHCVLHATISRGCPGEPDDPICNVPDAGPMAPLDERKARALAAVSSLPRAGQDAAAQFSLYTLGIDGHMDEIYGCIDFVKQSGVFNRSKNFCTKLRGDVVPLFATVEHAFTAFGAPEGHVTIDLTVSANSPTAV
ncbi:MAG: YkoF family thiamine/hydroxymethylpyrimidine-binding protein [Mesorhizobium sp.]